MRADEALGRCVGKVLAKQINKCLPGTKQLSRQGLHRACSKNVVFRPVAQVEVEKTSLEREGTNCADKTLSTSYTNKKLVSLSLKVQEDTHVLCVSKHNVKRLAKTKTLHGKQLEYQLMPKIKCSINQKEKFFCSEWIYSWINLSVLVLQGCQVHIFILFCLM